MTVTEGIGAFVAALDWAQVPAEVREKVLTCVLHDVGVTMAGADLAGPALAAAEVLSGGHAGRGARVPVLGTALPVDQAVMVTSAMMHARTQDDTHLGAQTHLGVSTLPAALAVAERDDASGEDLLVAVLAGYEAAAAIAGEMAPLLTARGFRATSVFGPFAAAAATARLLHLDADRTAAALGLAAAMTGGTGQTWVAGTQEWQYQVGAVGRTGLLAAHLAAQGVRAAPDALEGRAGLYRALLGDDAPTPDGMAAELGRSWAVLDVTYKPFPVCAINQVPVAVAVALSDRFGIRTEDVRRVRLVLHPDQADYPGTRETGPFTDIGGALMSAPFCLAAALTDRTVTTASLRRGSDEDLLALGRRVEIVADPSLDVGESRLAVLVGDAEHTEADVAVPPLESWGRADVLANLRRMADELPGGVAAVERLDRAVLQLAAGPARTLVDASLRPVAVPLETYDR